MPLRRFRRDALLALAACGVLAVGGVSIGIALFGSRRPGPVAPAALLPVFAVGIGGSVLLERRRRALVRRLREVEWRACTGCAYPLAADSRRCPECGLEITAHQAAAAWLRCPWAQ